jgi:hypothetical protein
MSLHKQWSMLQQKITRMRMRMRMISNQAEEERPPVFDLNDNDNDKLTKQNHHIPSINTLKNKRKIK